MDQMAEKLLVKYDLGMSINCLYLIEVNNMKKFNRNMLAHINAANKQSTQTVEKKIFNTNKKGIRELDKYGVIL